MTHCETDRRARATSLGRHEMASFNEEKDDKPPKFAKFADKPICLPYIYPSMYAGTYVYLYIYIHTYIYIYLHIRTYAYIRNMVAHPGTIDYFETISQLSSEPSFYTCDSWYPLDVLEAQATPISMP